MSLSKQQLVGAVGAGVFVLGAGVLGYLVYDAWGERVEQEEALETSSAAFRAHYNAPVFPSRKSLESVTSNKLSYAAWFDEAQAFALRGDTAFPAETPPVFKQRLTGEVRRMVALTGGVEGKIAAPTFLFGFEQYLGEGGVLPKDEDVPRLAMQLDTIAQVVDMFSEVGVLEVKSIRRIEPKPAEDDEEASRRGNRKNAKKAEAEDEGPKTTVLDYAFEFTTHPAALVEVLNRLTASARFMTVKDLAFRETADVIVDRLNAVENLKNQKASTRPMSRRRRRGPAMEEAAPAPTVETVDPLVIDPELDAPLLVSFTLEVRDFGHGVAAAPAPAMDAAAPAATNETAAASAPAKEETAK